MHYKAPLAALFALLIAPGALAAPHAAAGQDTNTSLDLDQPFMKRSAFSSHSRLQRRKITMDCAEEAKRKTIEEQIQHAIILLVETGQLPEDHPQRMLYFPNRPGMGPFISKFYLKRAAILQQMTEHEVKFTCQTDTAECSNNDGAYAHTNNGISNINVCDKWFSKPDHQAVKCDEKKAATVGEYVSKAATIAREILYLNYPTIDDRAEDMAQSPSDCISLRGGNFKGSGGYILGDGQALKNAHSYQWASVGAFFSDICGYQIPAM